MSNTMQGELQPILSLQRIGMHFGGLQALHSIDMKIFRHHITGLIGPNGAGKTTLFNCMTGFYRPTQGQIFFYPQEHKQAKIPLPNKSYRVAQLGIARTFQNVRLFKEMTSLENLLIAQLRLMAPYPFSGLFRTKAFRLVESQAIQTAYQWLDRLGLTNISNQIAGTLPYGQQRLLEIARALCTHPQLLCLDEPAAGMNPQETQALASLLQRLKSEHRIALLIIEHDMSLMMKICDQLVVLDHGQCIASGTPAQIQTNPDVIAAYLGGGIT